MNLTKVNNIAFKIVGGLICAFLFIGALGMLDKHLYLKSGIGIISGVITGMLLSRPASIKSWIQVIVLLFVTMMIVGIIK
nr:hypothetical protein [Mucilaginibacter sp. L294]